MGKIYKDRVEDRTNFKDLVMKQLTMPFSLIAKLRGERGPIVKDLGLRSVILFTLCCRVLPRLAHVTCPKKQARAVQRVEEILTGGIVKKRRSNRRSRSGLKTRDRVVTYIEKCISEYIDGDFEAGFFAGATATDLHSAIVKGDELLSDITSVMDGASGLSHLLPISVLSLVCVIVELMVFSEMKTIPDCSTEGVEELRRKDIYVALERVTVNFLRRIHSASGILPGGEGRPSFSPTSVFERDGEITKIAVSNVSLASALTMGSRMRRSGSFRKQSEIPDDEKMTIDTFFSFLLEAVIGKLDDEQEYDSVMAEGADLLNGTKDDCCVIAKGYLKPFLDGYQTLQRCNRVSILSFKGPGVVLRSSYVPEIVRCGLLEKEQSRTMYQEELWNLCEREMKEFRRSKKACLDSGRDVVRLDGKTVVRYACPIGKDVCTFLLNCVRVADKYTRRLKHQFGEENVLGEDTMSKFRTGLGLELAFGLFGSDLSGNIAELYEEYIYSFLMRHFDEDEGAVGSLKAAAKRRTTVRKGSRRSGRDRDQKEIDNPSRQQVLLYGLNESDDEDWGPTSE